MDNVDLPLLLRDYIAKCLGGMIFKRLLELL